MNLIEHFFSTLDLVRKRFSRSNLAIAAHPVSRIVFILACVSNPANASNDVKTLVMGVRADAPPFSIQVSETPDEYQGYSVALCNRIAKRAIESGLYCKTRYEEVTAANRLKKLAQGEIDLLCGATTLTLERTRVVDFSLLTFISGLSRMYKEPMQDRSIEKINKPRIGVLRGTTSEDQVNRIVNSSLNRKGALSKNSIHPKIIDFSDHLAGLGALQNGGIDYYLADREILLALQRISLSPSFLTDDKKPVKLIVDSQYYTVEPYALGISPNNRELRYIANLELSELFDWENARNPPMGIFSIMNDNFDSKIYSKSLDYLFRIQRIPRGSEGLMTPKVDCP